MQKKIFYWLIMMAVFFIPATGAQKKTIDLPEDNAMAELKPGPGAKVVSNNCSICHSTDYIVRQPKSDKQHWQAEVEKMIKVFGAPASQADVKVIVDYLASHYGKEEKK
jgi:sulfite dehydrogenase (cytochrome) subunit B